MKVIAYFLFCVICTSSCQKYGDFLTEIRTAQARAKATQTLQSSSIFHQLKQVFVSESLTEKSANLLTSEIADSSPYEVSSLCLNHTKLVLSGILQSENWALRSK